MWFRNNIPVLLDEPVVGTRKKIIGFVDVAIDVSHIADIGVGGLAFGIRY